MKYLKEFNNIYVQERLEPCNYAYDRLLAQFFLFCFLILTFTSSWEQDLILSVHQYPFELITLGTLSKDLLRGLLFEYYTIEKLFVTFYLTFLFILLGI